VILKMRTLKSFALAASALLMFVLFVSAKPAQAQQPAYLHALANLRQAHDVLATDGRPGFRGDRDHAMDEIRAAITEVQNSVHDEGHSARYTPPPVERGNPEAPMRSALQLLDAAYDDMTRAPAPHELHDLQRHTVHHINEARKTLAHALHIMDRHYDE
jgi:hypothetical protein